MLPPLSSSPHPAPCSQVEATGGRGPIPTAGATGPFPLPAARPGTPTLPAAAPRGPWLSHFSWKGLPTEAASPAPSRTPARPPAHSGRDSEGLAVHQSPGVPCTPSLHPKPCLPSALDFADPSAGGFAVLLSDPKQFPFSEVGPALRAPLLNGKLMKGNHQVFRFSAYFNSRDLKME